MKTFTLITVSILVFLLFFAGCIVQIVGTSPGRDAINRVSTAATTTLQLISLAILGIYEVVINSSHRTPFCNKNSGGAPNSYHLLGKALDLNCGSALGAVSSDITSKGPLYRSLRQFGINGFGISPSFLHIDTRAAGSDPDKEFDSYSIWHY